MAGNDDNASWAKDWQALQAQFLSAWQEAAKAAGDAHGMPLHGGLELWATLFRQGAGDTQDALVERVLASARQLVALMQGALAKLGAVSGTDASGWREAVTAALGVVAPGRQPMFDALTVALGQGAKGFEQWLADGGRWLEPLRREWSELLGMPAFGFTRETQERRQQLAAANLDYAEQLRRYQELMLTASQRGLARFESKLAERSEPGREIRSFREFYDVFIDAAEEGYAEIALSDEFRHVYGSLVNAQMRVRQLLQQEVEHVTASLGMPGRSELNAVHEKLTALQRRVAELGATRDASAAAATAGSDRGGESPAPPSAAEPARRRAKAASAPQPIPRPTAARAGAGKASAARRRKARSKAALTPAPVRPAVAPRAAAASGSDRAPAARPAQRGRGAGEPINFAERLAAARAAQAARRQLPDKRGR